MNQDLDIYQNKKEAEGKWTSYKTPFGAVKVSDDGKGEFIINRPIEIGRELLTIQKDTIINFRFLPELTLRPVLHPK